MKTITLMLVIIALTTTILSQNGYEHLNKYELKIGLEINHLVPSFGIDKNYYFSKYNSIAPELIMLGFPIAAGTYRFNFRLNKIFRISIQGGGGITFGAPLSMVGIVGGNITTKINNHIYIFIEPRIYFFHKDIVAIENGI